MRFMELDLASFDKVEQFDDQFLENEERLDILINNAGMISTSGDAPKLTEDGIERALMVNHLGHMFHHQRIIHGSRQCRS